MIVILNEEGCYPKTKLGTLGLMRSTAAPELETIPVQGRGKNPENHGAKGWG